METDSRNLQPTESILEDTVTVAEVAAEIEKPTAPRIPTREEIGEWRRAKVTITHGTVKACGHKAKFSATRQPHNNCVDCWKAFFMTSVDLDGVHVVLTKQGVRALVAKHGTKFTKMFHGFLAACLLPTLVGAVDKAIPAGDPAQIQGGTFANGHEGTEVQNPSDTQ